MSFDVRLYHKVVNVIAKMLPSKILGIIGRLLFRMMMLYLCIYSSLHKTRERFLEYKWILDNLDNVSSFDCLNVGCGDSLLDYELSRRFRRYVSIDLCKYPIAVKNPTIEFVQADITKAPFKDEVFDIILCISTIEHINDDITAMMEMRRLLKPGGKIYISAPLGPLFYNEKTIRRLQVEGLTIEFYKLCPVSDGHNLCMMILTKEE